GHRRPRAHPRRARARRWRARGGALQGPGRVDGQPRGERGRRLLRRGGARGVGPRREPARSLRAGGRQMRAWAAALLAAGALAAGCAHRSDAPSTTLSAFGAALERKDYEAAYALTSSDFRKRVPFPAFRAELEAGGADAQALGRRLRESAGHAPLR